MLLDASASQRIQACWGTHTVITLCHCSVEVCLCYSFGIVCGLPVGFRWWLKIWWMHTILQYNKITFNKLKRVCTITFTAVPACTNESMSTLNGRYMSAICRLREECHDWNYTPPWSIWLLRCALHCIQKLWTYTVGVKVRRMFPLAILHMTYLLQLNIWRCTVLHCGLSSLSYNG